MDGGVSPFPMNDKEIEALVMARPDMAQAVFHDIVPMGAFVELARAVEAVERERCAMLCEAHAGMQGTGAWVALTAAADRIRGLIE